MRLWLVLVNSQFTPALLMHMTYSNRLVNRLVVVCPQPQHIRVRGGAQGRNLKQVRGAGQNDKRSQRSSKRRCGTAKTSAGQETGKRHGLSVQQAQGANLHKTGRTTKPAHRATSNKTSNVMEQKSKLILLQTRCTRQLELANSGSQTPAHAHSCAHPHITSRPGEGPYDLFMAHKGFSRVPTRCKQCTQKVCFVWRSADEPTHTPTHAHTHTHCKGVWLEWPQRTSGFRG